MQKSRLCVVKKQRLCLHFGINDAYIKQNISVYFIGACLGKSSTKNTYITGLGVFLMHHRSSALLFVNINLSEFEKGNLLSLLTRLKY